MDKSQAGQEIQLMSMQGQLTFTRDGRWLHEGEEIQHQNIRDYYAKHLRWCAAECTYVIEVNNRAVKVEVEDTPVVIRTIDISSHPWKLLLSSGSSQTFNPRCLRRNKDDVFYYAFEPCPEELAACFKNLPRARLNHPAIQAIAPYLAAVNRFGKNSSSEPKEKSSPELCYCIVIDGEEFPILSIEEL